MRDSELRANTYKLGRAAIKRLEKDKTRHDWMQVGDAFLEARAEALEECGLTGTNLRNHRLGGGYNKAFGDILKRERLESEVIDSATRNNLFTIMDNKPDVEAALQLLDPHERAKLNHPSAVLRYWKRTSGPQDSKHKERRTKARDTSTELAAALQRIDELKAHAAELEAAREPVTPTSDIIGQALELVRQMTGEQREEFTDAVLNVYYEDKTPAEVASMQARKVAKKAKAPATKTSDAVGAVMDDLTKSWRKSGLFR